LYVGNRHGNGRVGCVAQNLLGYGSRSGWLPSNYRYIERKSEKIQIKYIWLLRTSSKPPQDGIGQGGKLTNEVDGIPGGLLHQVSIPDFEHFGWRLPKLATVTVTKNLVVLPKAVWDVTVWRPVAYIQVLTVLYY
jgi:hypothetical protein